MSDYVANCPVSRPRRPGWRITQDLGGMAWSYDWGMFYDAPSDDDPALLRPPTPPEGG